MQLFPLFLFLFLFNPIHGLKSTKMVITQQQQGRGLAVKAAAAAPAPASSNATSAPAPAASDTPPAPKVDLIALMSKKGCKNFASLVSAAGAGDVASTFEDSISGGLTVFCPTDGAMKAFMPKFKNLSADSKVSLLLYHGVPEYNNLDFLRNNNGVVNTLATAARDFNFTVQNIGSEVTLESHVTTASIKTTIFDKDPLAIFSIDTVLEPRELFKPPPGAPAPAPSPALAPAADAPAAGKKGKKKRKKHEAPAPAGPDAAPADQKSADENGVGRGCVRRWAATAAAMAVVVVVFV